MFGFLKRKVRDVYAPVDGNVVKLESVDDEVFSQKMVGDGVAILPISGSFRAPIDGVVSKIFSTNHAYSIKSDKDLEVMVHIGLETVALNGEGFTRIASEGDTVKVGDIIIEADLAYIR
jgi:PTS system glucose-specific IIA component